MEMEDTRLFEKYLIINIDNIQRKYAIRSRYGSNKNLTTGPDLQNIIKSDNDKGVPNDTPCTPISILQLKFRVDRILVLSILFFFFVVFFNLMFFFSLYLILIYLLFYLLIYLFFFFYFFAFFSCGFINILLEFPSRVNVFSARMCEYM